MEVSLLTLEPTSDEIEMATCGLTETVRGATGNTLWTILVAVPMEVDGCPGDGDTFWDGALTVLPLDDGVATAMSCLAAGDEDMDDRGCACAIGLPRLVAWTTDGVGLTAAMGGCSSTEGFSCLERVNSDSSFAILPSSWALSLSLLVCSPAKRDNTHVQTHPWGWPLPLVVLPPQYPPASAEGVTSTLTLFR